jgi:hypothetical protein
MFVMAGLDPAMTSSLERGQQVVDARHKAGHDEDSHTVASL